MGKSMAGMPRARTLGAALRQAREAKRMSQRAMAQELRMNSSTVSRWENGEIVPSLDDVATFLAVLEVGERERDQILDLARDPSESDWLASGPPGISVQLAGVMECERTATSITNYAPLAFPGTLQTSAYARAIIGKGDLSQAEIETRVTLRMGRRDIITRSDPVELLALIGEPAVRGGIGGAAVMADQLRHVLETSERKNVTVQVVPLGGDWHPGHAGGFVLYESMVQPPLVYLEHHRTGSFVVSEDDVEGFKAAADQIRRVAMSPEDSAELIADVLTALERT